MPAVELTDTLGLFITRKGSLRGRPVVNKEHEPHGPNCRQPSPKPPVFDPHQGIASANTCLLLVLLPTTARVASSFKVDLKEPGVDRCTAGEGTGGKASVAGAGVAGDWPTEEVTRSGPGKGLALYCDLEGRWLGRQGRVDGSQTYSKQAKINTQLANGFDLQAGGWEKL